MRSIFAVALFIHTAASAVPLWQGAVVGMSQETIMQKFPDARPPIDKSVMDDGLSCDLEIGSYKIGSRNFRVCFHFSDAGLDEVKIKLLDRAFRYDAEFIFNAMNDALTSKYGKYDREIKSIDRFTYLKSHIWIRELLNINLYVDAVGNENPINLTITYQNRISQEASKL